MKSIVTNQFPQIVWQGGDKHLWNPVQKKALKNRPEERIRLRVIEYLLGAGWSKHRISAEEGISSAQKGKLRTDLICYTQSFDPFLLVECKAPSVNISGQTARQIARYNKEVQAPYLLITNGKSDLWYVFKNKNEPVLQNKIPEPFQPEPPQDERAFEYWAERGFAGTQAVSGLRKWLHQTLNRSFTTSAEVRYLSFKRKLNGLALNHFYQIFSFSNVRIALGFLATAYGDTRLIAIENKEGENTAVLEINLDLLFKEQTPNASLYDADGSTNLDISGELNRGSEGLRLQSFAQKTKQLLRS